MSDQDSAEQAAPSTAPLSTDELLARSAELQRQLAAHEALLRGEERR
ncbi:hypothetical protein [Streptomyces lasiicapitis]